MERKGQHASLTEWSAYVKYLPWIYFIYLLYSDTVFQTYTSIAVWNLKTHAQVKTAYVPYTVMPDSPIIKRRNQIIEKESKLRTNLHKQTFNKTNQKEKAKERQKIGTLITYISKHIE